MAERAHPEDSGFQTGSIYRINLFKRYSFASKYTTNKDILDIPCGVGWGTSLLSAKHITGIDISEEAINYARKHYPRIDFLVGDMANILFRDSSIDVVICLEGYEHVEKDIGIKFLNEVVRILKKDGLLVMSCPIILREGRHSGNPYHLYEPTKEEIQSILDIRFKKVKLEIFPGPDGDIVYFVGKPL